MKEPVYVSASQIQVWRLCKRKAAFVYNEDRREPPTEAQAFGTRAHEHAARWLTDGGTPADKSDPTWIAFARGIGPDFLPSPGPENRVEHEFKLAIDGGEIHLLGYIDCWRPGEQGSALVLDHKFVSDVRYALSDEELLRDGQAVIYAGFALWSGADEVEARWIYYAKKSRARPRKVSATFTERSIAAEWERLLTDAREWAEIRRARAPAMSLEPNALACGAYGGCPFRADCNLSGGQKLAAHLHQFDRAHGKKGLTIMSGGDTLPTKENSTMTLAEKLAALKPKKPAQPQIPEVFPDPLAGKPLAMGVNPPEKDGPITSKKAQPHISHARRTLGQAVLAAFDSVDSNGSLRAELKKEEPAETPDETPAAPRRKLTVYLDCVPVKGGENCRQLGDLLSPSMTSIAESEGITHWALTDYGRGSALLAVAFDRWLTENPPAGSISILVDGSSAEARAVREVLIARADVVVRGV